MDYKLDTEGKRLQWILLQLDLTPYQFAKELNYKSPDSIYHIIKGTNKINDRFVQSLKETSYCINANWLKTGSGEPYTYKLTKGQYGSEYSIDGNIIYPSRLNYFWIRKIAINFAKIIFGSGAEDHSYSVDVRICGGEGLDFKYTSYKEDNEDIDNTSSKIYIDKYYNIVLDTEWRVISFFDYWITPHGNRRGQNILTLLSDEQNQFAYEFEYCLHRLLKDLIDFNDFSVKERFLNENDTFTSVYKNDTRELF